MGLRPVLSSRRPAAGSARTRARHGAQLRGLRRRGPAGGGDREGGSRHPSYPPLSRRGALRGVRLARREAARGPPGRRRGSPERRQRGGRGHLAARAHTSLEHRPRPRPPRVHAAHPPGVPRPGGATHRGPRRARQARRRRGLCDEPHVPARGALRGRVLRHGLALRGLLPLALVCRRGAGPPLLGTAVLPDGDRRSPGPGRPHRPSHRDRARRCVCRERVEYPARERAALVRLARHAGRGVAGCQAGPARRPEGGARTG